MLDMLMPVLDGKGFLQTVKLPIKYPETKLIIVSNVSEPLNDEEVDKYGVDDLILKVNLSPVELVNTVKKHTK
jgi:CheY-like chemotaxis protein